MRLPKGHFKNNAFAGCAGSFARNHGIGMKARKLERVSDTDEGLIEGRAA